MTDRELMQKALEALEEPKEHIAKHRRLEAITALRERLAQETVIDKSAAIRIATALGWEPPREEQEQEPVAWVLEWIEGGEVYASKLYESERRCRYDAKKDADAVCRPLVYGDTSPSKREWQGLTAAEFRKVVDGLEDLEDCWVALEHALKEKNT